MRYECTHINTKLIAYIDNDGTLTSVSGDERIVKGLTEYLDSFINSYSIFGDIKGAQAHYGDLVIQHGSLWSVDINNPLFVEAYLVPELTGMGYDCIKL